MMSEVNARRKPVFAAIGLGCPIVAVPLARVAADILVTGEDLVGYYGLWIGLVTIVVTIMAGCIATVVSFWRVEHPRILSIAAAAVNAAAALLLFSMTVRF